MLRRREFLALAAGSVAAAPLCGRTISQASVAPRVKALTFDAFAIFDLRPVFALADSSCPAMGTELSNAWRIRQFEYQWLRAWRVVRRCSADHRGCIGLCREPVEARSHVGKARAPDAGVSGADRLARCPSRPAVPSAGWYPAGSPLERNDGDSRRWNQEPELEGIFEQVLSVDRLRTFKPRPRAYQAAIDALGLPSQQIGYVAYAGWDAAGAKWFGYPTSGSIG